MPWVRIDDHFPDHPKVVRAGPLGWALHIAGLCYCNRNLTDGFVPRAVARRLVDFENIGWTHGAQGWDVDCELVLPMLLEAGLWKEVDDGYMIHDYLVYQPSKADVEAEREQKRQAGKLGGLRSAEKRREQATSKHSLEQVPKQPLEHSLNQPLKQNASGTSSRIQARTRTQEKEQSSSSEAVANYEGAEALRAMEQRIGREMPQ